MSTTTPITDRATADVYVHATAAALRRARLKRLGTDRYLLPDAEAKCIADLEADVRAAAIANNVIDPKVYAPPPPPTLEERFARSAFTIVRSILGEFISFNGPGSASVNVPCKSFGTATEAAVFANLRDYFKAYGDARVAKARAQWDREDREAEEMRKAARPAEPVRAREDDATEMAEQLARKIVCSRGKLLCFTPAGVVSGDESCYTMASNRVASCAAEDARAVFAAAITHVLAQQAQAHADDTARAVEAAVEKAAQNAFAAAGRYLDLAAKVRDAARQAKAVTK